MNLTEIQYFFLQAYSRADASLSFINYIMEDAKLVNLTNEEKEYVEQIKTSYMEILELTKKITEEIQKYKQYYQDFLLSDDYLN